MIGDSSRLPRLFDRKYMRWMLEEHCEGRGDLNRRIWSSMCLSCWCREFEESWGRTAEAMELEAAAWLFAEEPNYDEWREKAC